MAKKPDYLMLMLLKNVYFHQDDFNHTVEQARRGNELAQALTNDSRGSIKMAVVYQSQRDSGLTKIANQLAHIIMNGVTRLRIEDFSFEIGTSLVENGLAWVPATTTCTKYNVGEYYSPKENSEQGDGEDEEG